VTHYSWLALGIVLMFLLAAAARAMGFRLRLGVAGLALIVLSASLSALCPPSGLGMRLVLLANVFVGVVILLLDVRPPTGTSPSRR